MANDGGNIAKIAQWVVDTLAALTYNGAAVFRTVALWQHQVGLAGAGAESFTQYAPFAFVAYMASDAGREGGYDLREVIELAIAIGCESEHSGTATFGDGSSLGISKIRDLVIAALDRKHPDDGLTCDDFYYTGDVKLVDAPKRAAIQMHFETSKMTDVN